MARSDSCLLLQITLQRFIDDFFFSGNTEKEEKAMVSFPSCVLAEHTNIRTDTYTLSREECRAKGDG